MSNHSRSPHKIKKTHGDRVHKHRKERKILQKSSRVHRQKDKKFKPTDSDENDQEHQNELGTSSKSQTIESVLPLQQGPATSSQGLPGSANSGGEDIEYSDEYSAQSQDSGRTVPYPDLHVLTKCSTVDNDA